MFRNPIIAYNRPDPGVNRIGDAYYLVATGRGSDGGAFPLARSQDLVEWEDLGSVFPPGEEPAWSDGSDYWAPEIHEVKSGKICVYFCARDADGALNIGVATSDSPLGPFEDRGSPLVSDPHWAIDASYFLDDDGRQFVLWKIDGNAHGVPSVIKLRELDEEGTSMMEGSEEVRLIESDLPWEKGVVEGPYLVKRGGRYFLFYSGACYGCWDYCVGVARAWDLAGPYEKAAAPVLSSAGTVGADWVGPGHNVVLRTPTGDVMVYHAWCSEGPGCCKESGGRHVLADRVWWDGEDGWPRVGNRGTPTLHEQPTLDLEVALPSDRLQVGATYNLSTSQWPNVRMGYDGRVQEGWWRPFTVRAGLIPGASPAVSLEAADRPGEFLRHCNGRLEVGPPDSSKLFALDATWMALPGLSGGDDAGAVSLRSVNCPDHFVRHADGNLFIQALEGDELFAADATWVLSPA